MFLASIYAYGMRVGKVTKFLRVPELRRDVASLRLACSGTAARGRYATEIIVRDATSNVSTIALRDSLGDPARDGGHQLPGREACGLGHQPVLQAADGQAPAFHD